MAIQTLPIQMLPIQYRRTVTEADQAGQSDHPDYQAIVRRGFHLGFVREMERPSMPTLAEIVSRWQGDQACMLPGILKLDGKLDGSDTTVASNIVQSHQLMLYVLKTGAFSAVLDQAPYPQRLAHSFPLVASSLEEHDEQSIEKVYFDVLAGDDAVLAEDLWCKASWLSFNDDDASLRFRFSFGMECLEDVAADPLRQHWAGRLCDALFPESAVLSQNAALIRVLQAILGGDPAFVERIVYFNAPNGGAQMHHDVERGHDGVVFGQISGSTFWLALSKPLLMDELIQFCADPAHADDIDLQEIGLQDIDSQEVDLQNPDLQQLCSNRSLLSDYMEENDHELIEAVMDRCPAFIAHLCQQGYAYILHPGDVLLMPQRDLDHCVWHSVCCLGDDPGEALSFAVRHA